MKYTNKHNVPQEIINAVHNDSYSRGKATISATGLLQPPRIRLLAQEHYEELTIDISDEIWNLNNPRPYPKKQYNCLQWEKKDFYSQKINGQWILRKDR